MPKFELPDLPYKTDALAPHYEAEPLEIHHQKHHGGYVKKLNKALEDLSEARKKSQFDHLTQLQKDLAFNLSGHRLHSLLWNSLSPDGGGKPPASVGQELSEHFGSVDAFREQFAAAALSLQGSGWAALSREAESGLLIIEQVYDHQDNTGSGSMPLLVLDMWEHAFYLQYRNEKAKWVDAFWEVVNWSFLEKSLRQAPESVPSAA